MTVLRPIVLCAGLVVSLMFAQTEKSKTADAAEGKKIFEGQCLDCHRTDSTESKVGPGLKGVHNGKLPSGKPATHDVILNVINKGSDTMPAFKELMSEQEKEDVIAFVLTL